MGGSLDDIFAYCKQLGEEDYKVLLDKLIEEEKNRTYRLQLDAWKKVASAIENYIDNYGDIIITDNRDGDGIVLSRREWTSSPGLIEVE